MLDRVQKARFKLFLRDAKTWLPILGFVSLVLALELLTDFHGFFDRTRIDREVVGELVGLHQAQTDTGTFAMFSVRLATGQYVLVSPGLATPYRHGNRVKIIERTTGLGQVTYYFGGYVDKWQDIPLVPKRLPGNE